jgi:hypothetical protein
MTDNIVVNVILAILASAAGTTAIIGFCVFTFFFCQKRHQKRLHLRKDSQNTTKVRPESRQGPVDLDMIVNQTSSVMSEDDSIFTNRDKIKNSNKLPNVLDNDSEDDDSENMNGAFGKNMMHPYNNNNYNDDTWSYAVTEEGSVLVATLPAANKALTLPNSSQKSPQTLTDDVGRTMFEV